MKTEKILSTVLCGVLSLCAAFCGLLAALELTLFKEGYLARHMEKSGYFTAITNAIRVSCQGYAVDAGLNATSTDQFFTEEDVRADILINMDGRFRHTYSTTPTRFSTLVEYFENHIAWETDEKITPEQQVQLVVLQSSCERVYQEAVRPPFDAALSTLLQYRAVRKWGWIALVGLAAACVAMLKTMGRSPVSRRETIAAGVLGGALTLEALSAVLIWKLDYKSWMPSENLAQGLFCEWLEGFPGALAGMGLVLIGAVLIWMYQDAQKEQRAERSTLKTPVKKIVRRPAGQAPERPASAKTTEKQTVQTPRKIYRRPPQS